MLTKQMIDKLNQQINLEFFSSNLYLQMSAWCGNHGFEGAEKFLGLHAEEEQMHMKRLFTYIKETGAMPLIGQINAPEHQFDSLSDIFKSTLEHEKLVTQSINDLAGLAFSISDFSTFNFLQWYISEQHEEENLFSGILDKLHLLGTDGKGLFLFDKELMEMTNVKFIEPFPKT
jgi:ferritin